LLSSNEKEPLLIYILRLLLLLAILIFMIMIYWSSEIIEEKLLTANTELEQIKKDVNEIKASNGKVLDALENAPSESILTNPTKQKPIHPRSRLRKQPAHS